MSAFSQHRLQLNAQPIARRVATMLGFASPWSRNQKCFDQGTYDSVGQFMKKFAINPSPENYALVFNFTVKKDTSLIEEIGELIKTGFAQDEKRLPVVVEKFEKDLADLANNTQEQLAAIEHIISQTHSETKQYGTALQRASSDIDAQSHIDSQVLISLCESTRLMISKTRDVETELRNRSDAIKGLIGSLDDAKMKADTDALTGLSNRRAFERQLGAAFERARGGGGECVLAICDIDRFKAINDTFGHQTGDRIIQAVAKSLADNCEANRNT